MGMAGSRMAFVESMSFRVPGNSWIFHGNPGPEFQSGIFRNPMPDSLAEIQSLEYSGPYWSKKLKN
jgi:hypothetical protein